MEINHALGRVIIALAIPAALALFVFLRAGAGWILWAGPTAFLAFVATLVGSEYIWSMAFRSPVRPEILVPYLVLFFGSILLMGLPMFGANRQLWVVTAVTSVLLLG